MEQRRRWGIVGTGKIAGVMARALADSATGELVAVASRNQDRARRFASNARINRYHASYEALIADPDVEVVYVAGHHTTHHACATAAARAGKHVLCEKPLAMNAALAAEIVETARRNGVFLMEAFAYRCHPQTARLVEILANGAIGQVRLVDAAFGYDAGAAPGNYLLVRELGGGSILDVGCYPTSMAHLIAAAASGGQTAVSIYVAGTGHIGPSTRVDHYAAAVLRYSCGVIARVASAVQLNLDSTLRIYGTEGTVTVPSPWLPGRPGTGAKAPVIVVRRYDSAPQEIPVHGGADLYVLEADAVGSLLREGRTSHPQMTWEESLENMATIDRWRAAIGLAYPDDQGQANPERFLASPAARPAGGP
jgi:predicted dehydrogenase